MSVRPDVTIASRLAGSFQLKTVFFVRLDARIVPAADSSEGAKILDWSLEPVRMHWVVDSENDLRVVVPFRISITQNGKPHAWLAFGVRCDYALRPGVERPNDDDIDHFVGITAFMHSWPYVRAEAQSLTAKLGIPPLTLPVLLSGQVPDKVVVLRAPPELVTGERVVPAKLPRPKKTARKRHRQASKKSTTE